MLRAEVHSGFPFAALCVLCAFAVGRPQGQCLFGCVQTCKPV